MKVLLEVDLDNDELRAIARGLGRRKGKAEREEAKIYLAELVARDLDGLVRDHLDDPRLDRHDAPNRRGMQECVVGRGAHVTVARSCGQQALDEQGGGRGRPRRLRDTTVLGRPRAIPGPVRALAAAGRHGRG